MTEYRAYTVGSDGQINGVEVLVCKDDTEAVEKAERLYERRHIELWSGQRLVVRLPAERK